MGGAAGAARGRLEEARDDEGRVPSQAPAEVAQLPGRSRAIVSIPIFGAIFWLTYRMLRQLSPTTSLLVLVGGIGVLGYLGWIFYRARR